MYFGLSKIPSAGRALSKRFGKGYRWRYGFREYSECGPEKKALILGVYEGDNGEACFTPAAKKFDECVNGKLMEILKKFGRVPCLGEGDVVNNIDPEFFAIALVGLGNKNLCYNELEAIDEGTEAVRTAAGIGSQLLSQLRVDRILIEGLGHPEQAAEGSALALWRYQENKMREHWHPIASLELYDESDTESFQRGLFKAECQNLVRRLSDTPANQMTPLHFAQEAVNELCPCGIKVEVHDKDWIESKKMNAFLAVARGSCEPPIFLDITYCGGPQEQKPILLAGSGVTYDSGGLCLKPSRWMSVYRGAMVGAGVIVAAMKAASVLSLPVNINAVIPLCENMPSGMAMKPGDMVMGMNGKSIVIENTDNENRLMMADALVYGQNTYKPRLIIDMCTMSPSTRRALGAAASAVYCNSQTLWSQVRKAGIITGDRVWRMPLWKYWKKKITWYPSHDVNNTGEGKIAGTHKAAAFVNEFINCVDWIHFDIDGVGFVCTEKVVSYLTQGRMTGRPTRTLIQLLYQLACPEEAKRKITC